MGYTDKSVESFFSALFFLGARSSDRKAEVLACGNARFFMGQAYRTFWFSTRDCPVELFARGRLNPETPC
jgi:hypothetical protein